MGLTGGVGGGSARQRPPEGGPHITGSLSGLAEEGRRGEGVEQWVDGGVERQNEHRHPREHLRQEEAEGEGAPGAGRYY